jgi:hypothetical protein
LDAELLAPLDRLRGQRRRKRPAQVAAQDFGRPGPLSACSDTALPCGPSTRAAAPRAEFAGESGRRKRGLSVVFVAIDLAALRACFRGRFGFVDRRGDAAEVKDARRDKAAESRTDNHYKGRHGMVFGNLMERCSIKIYWNGIPMMSSCGP